jgi:hypothetical protein
MAKSVLDTDLYNNTLGVLNDNLYDLGISIDDKKTSGSYIYLSCDEDRSDTRESIEMELERVSGIRCSRTYVKSRSSFDITVVEGFGQKLYLVYKNVNGGMQETTLNSSITELFPSIAFEEGISPNLSPDIFYNKIVEANKTKATRLGAYKNKTAYDAGKEIIDKATTSSKFEEKTTNAQAITRWLILEDKRKKITKVVWGYRNNTKPEGVAPNHKGDIFAVFEDGEILGISLKAGGVGTAEPQFNSYVRPIFTSFGMLNDYTKLENESYERFYKNIPNITPRNTYGKSIMTRVIGSFEKANPRQYEMLYDEQLNFVREYICNLINENPSKAKNWLLREVAAEQEGVPLIVLKAAGNETKIINDENIIKDCVQTSKKSNGIKAYPSKTSKQNWHIDLTCKTHTTTLNFSIRTNKTGINHKLGQYINLAVKFNGV